MLATIFAIAGLYISFAIAPTDFQQGEAYRIIFVHVPAAWMSMVIYIVMAGWAALGLALKCKVVCNDGASFSAYRCNIYVAWRW